MWFVVKSKSDFNAICFNRMHANLAQSTLSINSLTSDSAAKLLTEPGWEKVLKGIKRESLELGRKETSKRSVYV